MRNLIVHYVMLFLPLAFIIYLHKYTDHSRGPFSFIIMFISYSFFYQPLLNANRLRLMNVIESKEFLKFLIPGYSRQYWKAIYWTW